MRLIAACGSATSMINPLYRPSCRSIIDLVFGMLSAALYRQRRLTSSTATAPGWRASFPYALLARRRSACPRSRRFGRVAQHELSRLRKKRPSRIGARNCLQINVCAAFATRPEFSRLARGVPCFGWREFRGALAGRTRFISKPKGVTSEDASNFQIWSWSFEEILTRKHASQIGSRVNLLEARRG